MEQLQDFIRDARAIYDAALAGVVPERLLARRPLAGLVRRDLHDYARIVVLAFGKAALRMAHGLESQLSGCPREGLVTVPHGYLKQADEYKLPHRIEVREAGHPVPDAAGVRAAEHALELAQRCGASDLLVVLISGGGSALWPAFAEGISLQDAQSTFKALLASGADIGEINTVRKHLSRIGGGRLAAAAYPAEVVALLISDVPGDDPSTIASGPTVPDATTFEDALDIVERHGLRDRIPPHVARHLEQGARGHREETLKPGDPAFERVTTVLVGSNRDALAAAREEARQRGYEARIEGAEVAGEAREVGRRHVASLRGERGADRVCLLWGGETTVTVRGAGKGGRNQELALAAALEMEGTNRAMALLSAGTDGIDGPTEAAGAVVTSATIKAARAAGLDPDRYLNDNDAWNLFQQLLGEPEIGGHIITGPTQTNVMDIQIGLVIPQ